MLRVRLRLLHHAVFPLSRGRGAAGSLLLLLAGGFVAGDFLFFRRAFERLTELGAVVPAVASLLVERLLGMLLLGAASMLTFSAVITSLSILYLSADLELLLASPRGDIAGRCC